MSPEVRRAVGMGPGGTTWRKVNDTRRWRGSRTPLTLSNFRGEMPCAQRYRASPEMTKSDRAGSSKYFRTRPLDDGAADAPISSVEVSSL